MNRVEVGFFSFTEVTDPGEHHSYNEWHQYDHLPEQYAIPGIVHGERWVATPACRAARIVDHDELGGAHYLTLYLMADPVAPTLMAFQELAQRLRALGRFHEHRRSWLFGGWQLVDQAAATHALVSPEVIPWRPATGVFVVVEDSASDGDGARTAGSVEHLLSVPGVAGVWSFAPSETYHDPNWRTQPWTITVLWLDDDVIETTRRLEPVLRERWRADGAVPIYAGPLETIVPGEWSWFDAPAE